MSRQRLDRVQQWFERQQRWVLYILFLGVAIGASVPLANLFHRLFSGESPPHINAVAFATTVLVASPLILFSIATIRALVHSKTRLRTIGAQLDARLHELGAAKSALSAAHDDLERRVCERTRELQTALQLADEANATKARFLANMSHELRTPLNAIIGFSDMITERRMFVSQSDSEADMERRLDDYAGAINRSGKHLLSLVSDLLDLSKLDCADFALSPERLQLRRTLDEAVESLLPQAEAKDQRIETDSSGASLFVFADRRALHQVLINLLTNALKYSPEGSVVRLAVQDRDGGTEFAVSDSGRGMSAEEIDLATVPFARMQNAHVATPDSVGLGLSIVKSLMTLHGGRLEIDSTPGRGTTVRVHFPILARAPSERRSGGTSDPVKQAG